MNSGESDNIRNPADNLLPSKPLDDFLKPPALSGVTISGRGRSAPSGGWPRAGVGALGIPPCDPPGPASRDRKVSQGPVEAEGGSG